MHIFHQLTNETFNSSVAKRKRLSLLSPIAAATPVKTSGFSFPKFYQEVLTSARANFTQEISNFQSKDRDISLAKIQPNLFGQSIMSINQPHESGRARRDAVPLAMQGWHSLGNGVVGDPVIIKDKTPSVKRDERYIGTVCIKL
ncbi:hypothetical protein M8C21_008090 [Ambrosia artemisiifolia]|uniref:Uncharacterized protein n=1 Tax=Ambrosia artemisiifolia TaxID=4212 RepID=A0AAD5G4B6_AMBAR|nr:hypothetical protein M8C21_008090 [Ambrosia artemisiifolia]